MILTYESVSTAQYAVFINSQFYHGKHHRCSFIQEKISLESKNPLISEQKSCSFILNSPVECLLG